MWLNKLTIQNRYEEESARLAEAWRKSQEKLEDLVSSLAYTAEDAGSVSGSPPDSLDDDFDDLLEADSKEVNSRLGSYSVSHITHLARLGRQRLQQASEGERAGFESQMKKLCPPREVRDFRMVRLRDAREGRKEATRTAMLNVWDARALGDELVEGKRFLVSLTIFLR